MIEVIVRGIPAPQGSKRHVGNGRMIESSKAVGPWREAIRAETQRVMDALCVYPISGPVGVQVNFNLPRPKGHYRTGKNAHLLSVGAPAWPAGTPDLDKLIRAVLDGLTMGGAWKDDGQVVSLLAYKRYADGVPVGCKIEITEVAG
jgi:crossover junction endodeoxyribonuclease RusA